MAAGRTLRSRASSQLRQRACCKQCGAKYDFFQLMTALSSTLIEKFCQHCDWAEQCWLLRKHLFDENVDRRFLFDARHAHFFNRLALILQEYWLHEVAKLHDRPKQAGRYNLTIDYILEYGGWEDDVRQRLQAIRTRLVRLADTIRAARNRLLSHNDLEIILNEESLGEFEEGADVAYFEALREYASTVHEASLGVPYEFDGLTPNDIEIFMSQFRRGAP